MKLITYTDGSREVGAVISCVRDFVYLFVCPRLVKLTFHDADTDTDIDTDNFARSLPTRPTRAIDFQKLFLWQAERGSLQTRRHPRRHPREDRSEDVGVGVRVGAV